MVKGATVTAARIEGLLVYRVAPPSVAPDAPHVVYLHGGAYLNEVTGFHWRFVRGLSLAAQAVVHVPIYALAPEATAEQTVAEVSNVIETLAVDHPNVTVMGDSAGGGLALSCAQALRDSGRLLPRLLSLISPWLDVRALDPQQRMLEPGDYMLEIDRLRIAGQVYAGSLPLEDPRVSPLLGELAGLPHIDVVTGTSDLLNPEAHALVTAVQAAGGSIALHEVAHMQHVFPLLPWMPEALTARDRLHALIRATAESAPASPTAETVEEACAS